MAADVSGNDLFEVFEDFHSSIDNYTYEENNDEIQSESYSSADYPMPYDYSSDFQNVFSLLSFMIAVAIGSVCLMCFLKGFK